MSIDINECIEMSDTCNMTGPVPADCINLQGSYRCTCDKHSGYHLSADGTTCEGIVSSYYSVALKLYSVLGFLNVRDQ